MPAHRFSLNLARIVERLTTDPRGWRVDDLREELRIKPRTYRKYRSALATFAPWLQGGTTRLEEVDEADGRWLRVRPAGDEDPALDALIERLTAFHLARQLFSIIGEPGLERPVRHALDELLADHRPRRYGTLAQLEGRLGQILHVAPDAPKDYTAHTQVVQELLRALVYARRVRMTYQSSASAEPRTHEIEPLTLALYRGGLHLFGRFPGHPRVYNFVVDRIQRVERLLGPGSAFPYPAPAEWSPALHTRNAFGIFVRDGERPLQVDLVFAPVRWLQLYLRERTWHPTQRFEELKGGRLRLTFEVGSLEEVVPWVRQFGLDVTVRSPAELRKALRQPPKASSKPKSKPKPRGEAPVRSGRC